MANSISKWILKDLKEYAETYGGSMSRLLVPIETGRKCQLVKWITPQVHQKKGGAIWAYISDKDCLVPVKFDREAITRYEAIPGQSKFSDQLGSTCTLKKIKLIFTKIPLDSASGGLSTEDTLALHVSEVTVVSRARKKGVSQDMLMSEIDPTTGARRPRQFTSPEKDRIIGRWIRGLRTGNGHVIQVEKERARDGEVNDVFTPPSSPHLQKDAQKEGFRSVEWDMPEEQRELFRRYNGLGIPEPESDVFSDESDDDGEEILAQISQHNDQRDVRSSPTTVEYDWTPSPARRQQDKEKKESSDEEPTDYDGSSATEVPCAQPYQPQPASFSFTFASMRSPKEEPVSQVLPPSPVALTLPATGAMNAEDSFSWPTLLNGQPQDVEDLGSGKGKEKERISQEEEKELQHSNISTIAPNSSNEISISPAFPPAQQSFIAAEEEDSNSSNDSDSQDNRGGTSGHSWDAQSQLSAIGDDSSEDELPSSSREKQRKLPLEEPYAKGEESLGLSKPVPGSDPVPANGPPSPLSRGPLEQTGLPTTPLNEHLFQTHGVKRSRYQAETSSDGPNKRSKRNQAAEDAIFKSIDAPKRTRRPSGGQHLASEARRPVEENDTDPTCLGTLKTPQTTRVSSIRPDNLGIRSQLPPLSKLLTAERRSDKWRKTINPHDE